MLIAWKNILNCTTWGAALAGLLLLSGCAGWKQHTNELPLPTESIESGPRLVSDAEGASETDEVLPVSSEEVSGEFRPATSLASNPEALPVPTLQQPASELPSSDEAAILPATSEVVPTPQGQAAGDLASIALGDVIDSIHATFPLVDAAYQELMITEGSQIAAWGNLDTKLKAGSQNGPVGFYQTYRHGAGIEQPLYSGSELFAGYRVGRGTFQPWYLERQTNDGGEFKAGVNIPLLKNRRIDTRRAEIWRANYDRQRAEPEIRMQLIQFVRDGSISYWSWVAAGRKYQIGKSALEYAEQRNAQLKRKVEVGDVDPPILQDSLRAMAQRQAKLIDLQRKLDQSAIKLSLFYRSMDGQPTIAEDSQLVNFPTPQGVDSLMMEADLQSALVSRPELAALDALAGRVNVDLIEAQNNMLPSIDAQIIGSQDVGAPTSSKRDKSPFELEAGIMVNVPLQRRKGLGKSQAAKGKLMQLAAKRRFTADKIQAEVQSAFTALEAAFGRLGKARQSRELADYMADVERRKFELGTSDLLTVAIREQSAIEAANSEVDALVEYFIAKADYDAALARDWPAGSATQPTEQGQVNAQP